MRTMRPNPPRGAALSVAAAALSLAASASAAPAAKAPYVAPRVALSTYQPMTKLPDWNGIYGFEGGLIFDTATAYEPPDEAADGGLDFGPRAGSYEKPPFKPEVQKAYEETVRKMKDEGVTADDVGDCKRPHGFPRIMGGAPGPIEIFMLPDQVRITIDWFNETRRIYTDGRGHPSGDELSPTYFGHSIGHWEGDTLVVDTVGAYGGLYDQTGAPYSDKVHVTERLTMVAPGELEDVMTIVDPVYLAKPWVVRRRMKRQPPNPAMNIGSYCEVNRVQVVNGNQVMQIPGQAAAK
jgi:hypothetical protein